MAATKRKFAAPLGLLINSSSTVDSSLATKKTTTGTLVVLGGVGLCAAWGGVHNPAEGFALGAAACGVGGVVLFVVRMR